MRKDMFKVIVERPRCGWRTRKLNRHKLDAAGDHLPRKQGLRRQRKQNGTDTKWLNENLAPLKRYLDRQVGRPWDRVYAEICENLDPGHTVKQHVLQHLDDFVSKPCLGRKGEWLWPGRFHVSRHEPPAGRLYVHPVDGLLKRWKLKTGEAPRRDRAQPARR